MTAAEFKKKWARYQGKETSAYQEHFNDLCRLLGQPTPAEADPSRHRFLLLPKARRQGRGAFRLLETPDGSEPTERGFADVWKKGCFGWEYKGKKKNLDEAYKQLLRYRESLLNPPLLVVCDFDRYIIRTNFNGTVQETHEFTNDQIDRPENLRMLRAAVRRIPISSNRSAPPRKSPKTLAEQIRRSRPVAAKARKRRIGRRQDPRRSERRAEEKSPHRPLPQSHRLLFLCRGHRPAAQEPLHRHCQDRPRRPAAFRRDARKTFRRSWPRAACSAKHKIRHFNGHLFEDSTVFELTEDELPQARRRRRSGLAIHRAQHHGHAV